VVHGGVIGEQVQAENVGIIIAGVTYSDSCCTDDNCTACSGGATDTEPFDFETASEELSALSTELSSLSQTAGATVEIIHHTLYLTCADSSTNPDLSVFTGVSLEGVTSIEIDCQPSQTVLINYDSTVDTFAYLGMQLKDTDRSKVVHHFTGEQLSVRGVELVGCVFAPFTQVEITGAVVVGNVIVGSFEPFTGEEPRNDGQINRNPFTGCLPPPTPANACCIYSKPPGEMVLTYCSVGSSCEDIPGWNLVSSSFLLDCKDCCPC